MLDAFASTRVYADHIAPVWRALPHTLRGRFYAGSPDVHGYLPSLGIEPDPRMHRELPAGDMTPVLVAGQSDIDHSHPRPVVLLEHGTGQTYSNDHACYPGGQRRERVTLHLCPNAATARATARTNPDADTAVVGCPRLDTLARYRATRREPHRVVGCSFHWPCTAVEIEAGWAWPEYRDAIAKRVAEVQEQWLGHGHPRAWDRLSAWWESIGVEPVRDFVGIVERADVYVCDNSSTIYEACALDLPVVLLNSKRWRRDVEHGLRFWEWANVGPQVDTPDQLVDAIEDAFHPSWAPRRAEATAALYQVPPGHSTTAAVAAIVAHLG